MKTLLRILCLLVISTGVSHASFSIVDIVEWKQLEARGITLQYLVIPPPKIGAQLNRYRFTLRISAEGTTFSGKPLSRVDYWKDDRSTEIPIEVKESLKDSRFVSLQVSEVDLETASVVIRFHDPNTSAESGLQLHLKKLIESLERTGKSGKE